MKINVKLAKKENKNNNIQPENKLGISFSDIGNEIDNSDKIKNNQEIYNEYQEIINGYDKKRKLPIKNYLTCFILLLVFSISVTGAKYISSSTGSKTTNIAGFSVEILADDNLDIEVVDAQNNKFSGDLYFGPFDTTTSNYTFTIKNKSDVAIKAKASVVDNKSGCQITFSESEKTVTYCSDTNNPPSTTLTMNIIPPTSGDTINPSSIGTKFKIVINASQVD